MLACELCHDFAVLHFLCIIVDLLLALFMLLVIPRLPCVRKS